jgi:trimeric autotransporter adhesin
LLLVFVPVFWNLDAQNIGIGTNSPHPSALLDVTSTNKGILVPRLSLTNVFLASPVTSPAAGLLVWNTNQVVTNGQGTGFYFWNGSLWQKLSSAAEGWSITGNNNIDTAVNFIGTTTNTGLMFRVGNQKAGGIFPFGGNTFLGAKAGRFLKIDNNAFTGENNTFIGSDAGESQIAGSANTFMGARAGVQSQGGFGNTFVGYQSGAGNGVGSNNTAIGIGAGSSANGSRNVSLGSGAGSSLGNGYENIMIGYDVGSFLFDEANAPAYGNVWIGSNAATGNFGLFPKKQSLNNVIIGDSAATKVNGAIANVFVGKRSGMNSLNGQFNVFVGDSSGINNTSGQRNTYIGSKARGSSAMRTNATAVGAHAEAGADNVMVLGSINGINGASASVNVGIGTTTPNRRLYIQDGTSSGVNSSGNSLLVLDKTGGPNYLSILNGNTFESGLVFGRAGSNQPPFDGGIFYNVSNTPGGMQFRNKGGLTRMVIHDDGNLSFGTSTNPARFFVALGTPSALTPFGNSTMVLDGGNASHYLNMMSNGSEQGLLFGNNLSNRDGGIFYSNSDRAFSFRTANASNRLLIDNLGRIGVGTATPNFRLHVVTNDAQNFGYREGILIENIATGTDGGGLINTGEAAISFKNAGANGTGTNQWMVGLNQNRNFAFAYGSEFAGGSITKMVIDSTGNVGIGIVSPTFQLQLSQNSAAKPGSNTWTVSSDERLKKDMHPFEDGLDVLEKINPIWFTYTGAENHPQEQFVGATAQAIQKVAPYMVTSLKEKSTVGDNLLGVDYGPLQFIMVNAIKEQQQIIKQQQTEIELLKKRLDALEKRK